MPGPRAAFPRLHQSRLEAAPASLSITGWRLDPTGAHEKDVAVTLQAGASGENATALRLQYDAWLPWVLATLSPSRHRPMAQLPRTHRFCPRLQCILYLAASDREAASTLSSGAGSAKAWPDHRDSGDHCTCLPCEKCPFPHAGVQKGMACTTTSRGGSDLIFQSSAPPEGQPYPWTPSAGPSPASAHST